MALLPDAPAGPVIASLANEEAADLEKKNTNIMSEVYEHTIPDFAKAAIDKLYGSLYASVRYLALCRPYHPMPHTWVGYQQGEVNSVLLFEIKESALIVLSEMITLTDAQIDAFSRVVFARYPAVMRIIFNAVYSNFIKISFPNQHYIFSENYILNLPENRKNYLPNLGKSTRKTIRLYSNRLQKNFPDFQWQVYSAEELPRPLQQSFVLQLQAFKQASMAARYKKSDNDPDETKRLLQLAAESGLFGMAMMNGEIRSGSLACRVGNNYVMLLSAADPALEKYRLGLLTCYWSVCDCIDRGAQQCHLLWGRYQYKSQLLAVPEDLRRLTLYRSRWVMATMLGSVIRMALESHKFQWQKWLLYDVQHKPDLWSRLVARLVFSIREYRRKAGKSDVILEPEIERH